MRRGTYIIIHMSKISLTCEYPTGRGSGNTFQTTASEQGGVVSEPFM